MEPLETPLPTLPQRREALWTEVQSLLDKGAIEEIFLGAGGGGVITPITPHNKENRRISSHLEPQGTQCLPPRGEAQDGNPGIDSSRSATRHVDDFSGLEGCLPPRPYLSTPHEVSEFCIQRSTRDPPRLPMGSPPIRVGNRTQGVHQDISPYCGPFTSQEYVYVPVHRRHLPCADFQGLVILTQDSSVGFQLGFVFNLANSSLIPSQVMTHLGAWIDILNATCWRTVSCQQVVSRVPLT